MCDSHDNDVIFNKLKIKHKYVFASQCYGYNTESGLFPCCNRDDYEALTKIALALFEKCEKNK